MGKPAKLDELVERHIAWLRLLNRSDKTIKARRDVIRRLGEHIGHARVLRASLDDIESFLSMPSKIPSTRAVEGSHLRQWYKWLTGRGHIKCDPTIELAVPKKPRRLPRPANTDSVIMAINLAQPETRVILLLAAICGLRAGEIAALRADDINWAADPPTMLVDGKGRRERVVPIPHQLAVELAELPRTGHIVRYRNGRAPVPSYMVSSRANTYLKSLHISSVHTFRHSAGTRFYRASGRDLRMTQEFLGHQSPLSTAIYTAVDPVEIAEVSEKMQLPLDNIYQQREAWRNSQTKDKQ